MFFLREDCYKDHTHSHHQHPRIEEIIVAHQGGSRSRQAAFKSLRQQAKRGAGGRRLHKTDCFECSSKVSLPKTHLFHFSRFSFPL
jgi:hypothetical protein